MEIISSHHLDISSDRLSSIYFSQIIKRSIITQIAQAAFVRNFYTLLYFLFLGLLLIKCSSLVNDED